MTTRQTARRRRKRFCSAVEFAELKRALTGARQRSFLEVVPWNDAVVPLPVGRGTHRGPAGFDTPPREGGAKVLWGLRPRP